MSPPTNKQVVLIAGASSGIGRVCGEYLAGKGMTVYGASRSLQAGNGAAFAALRMDVTDDKSVLQCVQKIHQEQGRLDVVINCAGYGVAGAVEDTSPEEAMAQFDTNFFGTQIASTPVVNTALGLNPANGSDHQDFGMVRFGVTFSY